MEVSGCHDWEATERVLEWGGFESRQRVLVAEPAVEPSGAGARWLGVTYWRAVAGVTRGVVRATWGDGGGRVRLLGGLTLLRFRPPELQYTDGVVSCRYAIEGGLLALRAGGSVTLHSGPSVPSMSLVSLSRSTCRGWRREPARRGGRGCCS